MNRLARNFTSGFSIQLFRKMMKSKNNKRCTPETMRNAFAMPIHVASQQATAKVGTEKSGRAGDKCLF